MTKTLIDVFHKRAAGVGHILRNRGIWRMQGFAANERLSTEMVSNPDGSIRLRFRRASDGDALIEFNNIQPGKLANVSFGEETIGKTEVIGSSEQVVDNRDGVDSVAVSFRDLFGKSSGKEHTDEKSAGTSITVSVSASEDIEGVASFEESVETEAHAEIAESETTSEETTSEVEGEEGTTVPVGKRIKITEVRKRADVTVEVTANGTFTHDLTVGKHSGGRFKSHHGHGKGHWDSWEQFCSVVKGDAPDNWDLAASFRDHHPWHADLWALNPLNSAVKYTVKYEGRMLRSYSVETY